MRKSLFPLLLLLPAAAFAASPECKYSQPRDLQLDLAGIKTVVFDIGQHDLKLVASPGARSELQGQACASEEKLLSQLTLSQRKHGEKLHVTLKREGVSGNLLFNNYAYMKLAGTLPDNITVQLDVGSGHATITGASIVSADVGSGDAEARNIRGLVAAKVGSGDIQLEDIGSLEVISVGSGDLSAKRVKGPVKVGGINSGDFQLQGAKGDVQIQSVGSGDATVGDVSGDVRLGSVSSGDFDLKGATGNVEIGSVGSGDAHVSGISGKVDVESVGSGGISARDVRGDFSVHKLGSGSIDHSKVDGRVSVPSKD